MAKDGNTADNWDVIVCLTSFIIDVNGLICRKIVGEVDWKSDEIYAYIQALFSTNAAN